MDKIYIQIHRVVLSGLGMGRHIYSWSWEQMSFEICSNFIEIDNINFVFYSRIIITDHIINIFVRSNKIFHRSIIFA